MNLIVDTLLSYWKMGRKTKQTPAGWISGNAPCCHHRGERQDKRSRGGIILSSDGFSYSCFNCGFKAGWTPGKLLSKNTRDFMRWLGIPDDEVKKLGLEAIKHKDEQAPAKKLVDFDLKAYPLPDDCLPIEEWINAGCTDPDLLDVVAYILDRGMELDWYQWHWSAANGYRDRVIIPFYHEGKIVGWTGRKIKPGQPKYLTHSQPSYVFNLDHQTEDRIYTIVVEGQFDAIAVDGCAIGHNEPSEAQVTRLNALGKEIIVVPDNDIPGTKMLDAAIEHNWSVSLPNWGPDVKDVADAVRKFGRIYTLFTILKYRERGGIRITMLKKKITAQEEHNKVLDNGTV